MPRVLRKTGTVTIVVQLKSTPSPDYPATKFGQEEPTREYIGAETDEELAALLEAKMTAWVNAEFPKPLRDHLIELVSVGVVVT